MSLSDAKESIRRGPSLKERMQAFESSGSDAVPRARKKVLSPEQVTNGAADADEKECQRSAVVARMAKPGGAGEGMGGPLFGGLADVIPPPRPSLSGI